MEEIWTFAQGGWGDIIASYGNTCKILDEKGLEKANVVFYGLDFDLVQFLKSQDRINKVSSLIISDPIVYFKYAVLASSDFPTFMEVTGLDKSVPNLLEAHINRFYNIENPTLCHRNFSMKLPEDHINWEIFYDQHPDYLIFQPFSCHSCKYDSHWPHWMAALEWVLENYNKKIILIGQLVSEFDARFKFPWISHENLLNMVGQTKNMFDVLRIMAGSQGVVTTSNCLSMWSILNNKPSMVICNQYIKEKSLYYYNWIHHNPNTVFDFELSLEDFKTNFDSWFQKLKN